MSSESIPAPDSFSTEVPSALDRLRIVEVLGASLRSVHEEMQRLGMDEQHVFADIWHSGEPLRLYGGPIGEFPSAHARVVFNHPYHDILSDKEGILVDDYVVGPWTLTHTPGYMPCDEEGNFEESDEQPPIIWESNLEGFPRFLFDGAVEASMPESPTFPLSSEEWLALQQQKVMAQKIAAILRGIAPHHIDFKYRAE